MTRWPLLAFLLCLAISPACAQTLPRLPSGIAYDAQGNLFLADTNSNRILESSVAGSLTVIAGTGEQGYAGDNGPATAALLSGPQGVAVAANGTIYVADTGNQVIRAITPTGTISTVAGTGTRGFSGDGGSATSAQLNQPVALALTSTGTLLVADSGNHRIRAVAGGVITTFAGSGVQGFGGDGAQAGLAVLDTPQGVAVAADGRVWIADSHNHRLRVVAADGTITTAAGTGTAGFSGDGGPAIAAQLSLPRGIAPLADGSLIFADANNQRLRRISTAGTITTIAGSGTQGGPAEGAPEASAALNNLRGVAASPLGAAAFADSSNRLIRAVLGDQAVYSAAGLVATRSSTVTASATSAGYGASVATVNVQGAASTPQGQVSVFDNGTVLATAVLANGAATLALPGLAPGTHTLLVNYAGDGFNPAATSSSFAVTVSVATVVATADAVTTTFGSAIPLLTGTLVGVQPQDAASVSVSFSSPAASLSPPAMYPILATLSGPASSKYTVVMAPSSGNLTITKAPSAVTLQPAPVTYSGLSWTLSAAVAPVQGQYPTGTVAFLDGGTVVATGTLAGGLAAGVYVSPAAGSHALTASYGGDTDFLPGTSAQQLATVGAMPDFGVSSGSASQTVQVGTVATFPISLNSLGAPFSNPVTLSVTGLPANVLVSLAPPTVIPGSNGATSTLSFPTTNLLGSVRRERGPVAWLGLLPMVVAVFLRRRRGSFALLFCLAVCALTISGCGTRTVPDVATQSKTWTLTITGTATNLAGAVVSHSTQVNVTVE